MAASFGKLPPWVGALLTGGAVVLLAAANGGYFSSVWPFAALAFAATGLLLAAIFDVRGPPPCRRLVRLRARRTRSMDSPHGAVVAGARNVARRRPSGP